MTKDLSKLPIKAKQRSEIVNPKDIFKSLTLRGPVQNILEPQAEALGEWFDKRLRYLGLSWPACIDSLESYLAIDPKQPEQMNIGL